MTVSILSIDHYLQYIEAETDDHSLRVLKQKLRGILEGMLGDESIGVIFEESSPARLSIAQEMAREAGISWENICMTTEERVAAGIFDALRNRPGSPDLDDMSCWIEYRIPADKVREDYFVRRIEEASDLPRRALVLLGDMHVQEVAKELTARGHEVEITQELIPTKRWAELADTES